MFTTDVQGFSLTDKNRRESIADRITVNSVSREVVYRDFDRASTEVLDFLPFVHFCLECTIMQSLKSFIGLLLETACQVSWRQSDILRWKPQLHDPFRAPTGRKKLSEQRPRCRHKSKFVCAIVPKMTSFFFKRIRCNRVTTFVCCTTDVSLSMPPDQLLWLFRLPNSIGNAKTDVQLIANIFSWSWLTWIPS